VVSLQVANAPWPFGRMKNNKTPWYQLKDSETKWYHHLMHGRVLIMLVLIAIVCFLAIGVGIYSAFFAN
jgi:ABC-type phosphate transport system permease subunit